MLKESESYILNQTQTTEIASPILIPAEKFIYPGQLGLVRHFYYIVISLCILTIAFKSISRFGVRSVWDDSFMFVRYANNLINDGSLAWNPGGEPTYGLTSLLYLIIILPLRLVFDYQPGIIAVLASLLCGILFLVLLPILLEFYSGVKKVTRRSFIMLTFFAFATSMTALVEHLTNGMDTAFTMSFLTIYLILGKRFEHKSSLINLFLMGIWGGLAFAARPDLVLYSFGVPLALLIFGTNRLKSFAVLMITATITGTTLLMNILYFKTPLPLSFYAKGLKLYGDHILSVYSGIAWQEFLVYLNSYWYFFALIGLNLIINFKGWWKHSSAFDKGLMATTFVFLAYYAFFVLQIMGYNERFYYPTFPVLLYLACRSLGQLVDLLIDNYWPQFQYIPRATWFSGATLTGLIAMTLLSINLFPAAIASSTAMVKARTDGYLGNFNLADNYRNPFYSRYWFRLDEFSTLPDDFVIATTEVGYPAALNPRKNIIDMAGLNERDFALNQFSADVFFEKYRPDLIYLPHPDYQTMIESLTTHPYYTTQYMYFPKEQIGTDSFGIAIRRDSKYFEKMLQIVAGATKQ